MGVRGLTSYVNSIGSLWTQTELRNTKLVIDGPGLCNCLYVDSGFDRQCGGQYEEFYNVVLSFFDALNSRGVDSFVVLDGAHDRSDKKLDTFKKRSAQRIQAGEALCNGSSTDRDAFVLPLLSNLVFLQALRDRGIKFAVPDCEADAEVASLANAWNCPVLSNDSDFFIFDIKAGYIPLSSFDWKSSHLTAKIFHQRKLASHLGIRSELLPMFASLVGNDYVSSEALEPFIHALDRSQYSLDHSSRKEARFARIANMLSTVPDMFVLQMVSSYGGVQLRQAVEHSLQEYSITESNLLRYFQNGEINSSLRIQNGREIDEWLLRKFRKGQFSTNCMSGLTSGKVLLRFQVENCREKSANYCAQKLRRFVYGILNDAEDYNRRGNVKMVEEWDREGWTVKPSNVTPCQEGVVRVSLIPRLDAENRLMVLLNVLNSNTRNIQLMPGKFKLIAASLRFLKSNAQPPLKTNHVSAILCCYIKLEDGSWKQYVESAKRRMSLSHSFDRQAAQSFAQWQCVLRDAVHLNFVLLEPVETPCIHKTFNGGLAHCLQNELDRGRTPEELLPTSSNRVLYKEFCSALEREDKISVGLNTKYPGATRQNSYQTWDTCGSPAKSYGKSAVYSPTKRWEEHGQGSHKNQASASQGRQTNQASARQQQQQQQLVSSSQYNAPHKRHDRPMRHSQVPQGGASSWGLPFSSSSGYYQKQQYAQPSAYSSGHHTGKPQQVTPTSSNTTQRAYTQQIGEDVISARIQNLNLRANPSHSSKNFTAGENRQSRSALPLREISLPGWVSPSSKSASAASYNPVGYGNESKTPPNTKPPRAMPGGATGSYSSATHCSPSSIRLRDEPELVSPARSDYGQRFFYDSFSPGYSPISKSASAASYNPVCYGNESKTPPNAKPPRAKPGGATESHSSATHCSPSSIRLRDESVLVSPVRSDYCQRFFDDLSSPGYSPLPFDESCSASDSSRSSDDGWPYEYYADYDEFW